MWARRPRPPPRQRTLAAGGCCTIQMSAAAAAAAGAGGEQRRADLVPEECCASDVELQQRAPAQRAPRHLLYPKVQHPALKVDHVRGVHLRRGVVQRVGEREGGVAARVCVGVQGLPRGARKPACKSQHSRLCASQGQPPPLSRAPCKSGESRARPQTSRRPRACVPGPGCGRPAPAAPAGTCTLESRRRTCGGERVDGEGGREGG